MVNYKKTNQCALKYSGQLLKGRGSNTSLSVSQTGQVSKVPTWKTHVIFFKSYRMYI